tara:strand:- start:1200 stop:1376 length:177 start_codon:yes stop_codon:yes gene_type:complete
MELRISEDDKVKFIFFFFGQPLAKVETGRNKPIIKNKKVLFIENIELFLRLIGRNLLN